MSDLDWGDMPYDTKTPAEVVHDYAVTRGDLCEQYARDQLAGWIERYARHLVDEAEEAAWHRGFDMAKAQEGRTLRPSRTTEPTTRREVAASTKESTT